MRRYSYTEGLHDLGSGCFAYLQPDGGWGLSNAGLVLDGNDSLLIDTLIDLPRARRMLDAMAAATPAAKQIGTVLNTHAHPDHTGGNALFADSLIIASEATAEEMRAIANGPMRDAIERWREFGETGAFLHEVMGSRFEIAGLARVYPNRTFATELTLHVGVKEVRLIKVGPAHTQGDTLAYVPADRVVYTGDILFHQVHPLASSGSIQAWIDACDQILGWDVEIVVPGHGPLTDKSGVRRMKDYWEYARREARKRFDAGMSFDEAARDIVWDAYRGWVDEERIFSNVNALYREFGAAAAPIEVVFRLARKYRRGEGSSIGG